jgi:hypothetical protein
VQDCIPACALGDRRFTRVFDLVSGFYQVPLQPAIQKYFAARLVDGGSLTPLRLPMGVCFAPDLLEIIVRIIVKRAILLAGRPEVAYHVHIDNVRFAAKTQDDVDAVAQIFQQLCAEASVTVTEEDQTIFLGVEYDFLSDARGVVVRPSAKSAAKLAALAGAVLHTGSSAWGSIRELFSRCIYLSRITRMPLGIYYNVFKYMRRRLSQLSDDSSAETTVWGSIVTEWKDWVQALVAAAWTFHPPESQALDTVLFTDASLSGYGAILTTASGSVLEFGGSWSNGHSSHEINSLEAEAVFKAASHFKEQLRAAKSITLVVDNTSTQYALRKGSAACGILNNAVTRALGALPRDIPIRVLYIPSASNPADPISRGSELSLVDLRSACGLVAVGSPVSSLRVCTAGRSATLRT